MRGVLSPFGYSVALAWVSAGCAVASMPAPRAETEPVSVPRPMAAATLTPPATTPPTLELQAPNPACLAASAAARGHGAAISSFVTLPDGAVVAVDHDGRAWRRSPAGAWGSTTVGFVSSLKLARDGEVWASHSSSVPEVGTSSWIARSLDGGRTFRAFDLERRYEGKVTAGDFIQAPSDRPVLLANGRDLYGIEVTPSSVEVKRFASAPGETWFGSSIAGFYYLNGSVAGERVTWTRSVSSDSGPWIQLHGDVRNPFCTTTSCWSAATRILGTPAGQNDWQVPSGAAAWLAQARQCLGLAADVRMVALGGAAQGDDVAMVLAAATKPPRAVLVSTRLPSIEFPFAVDFQPVSIAFDPGGNVLAAGRGVFSFDGSAWRRLGP